MRVDRLLSILLIILNKRNVTGKELSEHFEVSLRTIYRDIDKLCEAGVPIAANGGVGGGYYIMDNYMLDKNFFNKNEIKPLMALMSNLDFMFSKNAKFNDMALKFEGLFEKNNDELLINMSHISMEEELKEALAIINKSIENSLLLEFDYINRRMDYGSRIVEPIQMSYRHGEWYLRAYCKNRKDYRSFKLIRMRNLKFGEAFKKTGFSKEEIQNIFDEGYNNRCIKVILKFSSKIGEHLKEHFVKDNIKESDDGNFIVEELYPHEEGLIKFILSFGEDCEVIEPEYLRKETKEYIKNMYNKYND